MSEEETNKFLDPQKFPGPSPSVFKWHPINKGKVKNCRVCRGRGILENGQQCEACLGSGVRAPKVQVEK